MVMGRMKPGANVDHAQANIGSIARDLQRLYPQTNDHLGVAVYSLTGSPFTLKRSDGAHRLRRSMRHAITQPVAHRDRLAGSLSKRASRGRDAGSGRRLM